MLFNHKVKGVRRWSVGTIFVSLTMILFIGGCGGTNIHITLTQAELLHDIEAELPLPPDSIVQRYQRFDSSAFRIIYHDKLISVITLIDSLNQTLPVESRIDTLSIDHYMGNFGEAAKRKSTLFISSSYFIIYDDQRVLRSIIFHEFGHLRYDQLDRLSKDESDTIWIKMQQGALLYLFHDGEYSGNARSGGHPSDSPSELFASAFNILNNRADEFRARLIYVDPKHLPTIRRFAYLVSPQNQLFQ